MAARIQRRFALLLWAFVLAVPPVSAADKGVTTIYDQPIAAVRKACEDALATIGVMKLKRSEPELLEGQRSRKVGAFVGSGGEVLTVRLKSLEPARTEVTVSTKKTMVGMAGQKNWNEPLIAEIGKLVADGDVPAAAPAADTASQQ